jgi:hypothetical protein
MAESNEGRSMAAPLSDCTIEEQCAIVHFLWAEGVKSVELHRRMLAQYGARTMHQWKIYKWIKHFEEGRTSVTDESRPGHPLTSRTDQHIQRVDALIREDWQLTLAQHRFGLHGDVQQVVQTGSFSKGLKMLAERYQKCIIVQGDYVEK